MVTEAKLPLPSVVGMVVVALAALLGLLWPVSSVPVEEPVVDAIVEAPAAPSLQQRLAAEGGELEVDVGVDGFHGLRLVRVADGSVLREMGLREGDVLAGFESEWREGVRHVEARLVRDGRPLRLRYQRLEPRSHERRVLTTLPQQELDELTTSCRVVPAFRRGEPIGVKIFSARPGSLFAQVGLESGDIVTRVNGYDIKSPDRALEAYQSLKDDCVFRLDLLRKDEPRTIEVVVQPLCEAQ